jgi:metallophosphoesterase (TIGR00282 family)
VAVNILAVGDVCGRTGVEMLEKTLPAFKRLKDVSFCVVNGENADHFGISPKNADALFSHGTDVITLGNHVWGQRSLLARLDEDSYILRPANLPPRAPGRGFGVFESPFGDVCVINLLGRHGMDVLSENPFAELDRILDAPEVKRCKIKLVDLHGEATSEKIAMGLYADGRVTALWGTHTHVQTSDGAPLPGGTGYITDLGMTGAARGVLGLSPERVLERFLGLPAERSEEAPPPAKLEAAIFEVDEKTGACLGVEAIRLE